MNKNFALVSVGVETSFQLLIFFPYQDVTIPVNDDSLPEVDEYFTLNLTSVSPMDGSTTTSAASLKPSFTEVNITIEESDYPNGLLQFMSNVPAANETITPSSSQFNIDTRESARTLTLHVIRAQGTLGKMACITIP